MVERHSGAKLRVVLVIKSSREQEVYKERKANGRDGCSSVAKQEPILWEGLRDGRHVSEA